MKALERLLQMPSIQMDLLFLPTYIILLQKAIPEKVKSVKNLIGLVSEYHLVPKLSEQRVFIIKLECFLNHFIMSCSAFMQFLDFDTFYRTIFLPCFTECFQSSPRWTLNWKKWSTFLDAYYIGEPNLFTKKFGLFFPIICWKVNNYCRIMTKVCLSGNFMTARPGMILKK